MLRLSGTWPILMTMRANKRANHDAQSHEDHIGFLGRPVGIAQLFGGLIHGLHGTDQLHHVAAVHFGAGIERHFLAGTNELAQEYAAGCAGPLPNSGFPAGSCPRKFCW